MSQSWAMFLGNRKLTTVVVSRCVLSVLCFRWWRRVVRRRLQVVWWRWFCWAIRMSGDSVSMLVSHRPLLIWGCRTFGSGSSAKVAWHCGPISQESASVIIWQNCVLALQQSSFFTLGRMIWGKMFQPVRLSEKLSSSLVTSHTTASVLCMSPSFCLGQSIPRKSAMTSWRSTRNWRTLCLLTTSGATDEASTAAILPSSYRTKFTWMTPAWLTTSIACVIAYLGWPGRQAPSISLHTVLDVNETVMLLMSVSRLTEWRWQS